MIHIFNEQALHFSCLENAIKSRSGSPKAFRCLALVDGTSGMLKFYRDGGFYS
jgi:hypothetical protein